MPWSILILVGAPFLCCFQPSYVLDFGAHMTSNAQPSYGNCLGFRVFLCSLLGFFLGILPLELLVQLFKD
jgi:hypothetical protein